MARYYIDTCIWRDLIENRSDRFRSLGNDAKEFLRRCIENKDTIIWSPIVEHEIHSPSGVAVMKAIMAEFQNLNCAQRVSFSLADLREARGIAKERGIRDLDALHAVLAGHAKAILVTRNGQLQRASGIVEVRKPEDVR